MASKNLFNIWLENAEVGEELVYNEGMTYEIRDAVKRAALRAYDMGLVELFQRRRGIARNRRVKGGDQVIYNYEYIAVRVSKDTSRRLDFYSSGYCRDELA